MHTQRTIPRVCEQCGTAFAPKDAKQRFCSHACYSRSIAGVGQHNPRIKKGYVMVYAPNHPDAGNGGAPGYIREHRLVMEQILGRFLLPDEHVHHINEIKTDNRPENLMVVSNSEHGRIHGQPYIPPQIPEPMLIAGLQEAARRLQRIPRRRDMKTFADLPSDSVYHERYGGWNNALIAAGMQPTLIKDGSRWSSRRDSCADCGETTRPHYAHGFCQNCYARQRRKA